LANNYFRNTKEQGQQKGKHIVISIENLEKLKNYARPGNSWNDVITRILDMDRSSIQGGGI
jgi:uncharacterized FlgJ-related protein